jgi:hypothetical protein
MNPRPLKMRPMMRLGLSANNPEPPWTVGSVTANTDLGWSPRSY